MAIRMVNWFNKTFWLVCITPVPLFYFAGVHAQAAEVSPTEKAQLERIESLEKRIEYLEGLLKPRKDANEPPEASKAPIEDKQGAEAAKDRSETPSQDLTLEKRVEKLESASARAETQSANDLRAYWKDGLHFSSTDEQFKLKVGGRTAVDSAWFNEDNELKQAFGDQQDGTEFRRAFLYMSGLINGWVEYKSEFEFAGGDAGFEDVYVGFTKLPYLGRLRIGHMDEPFGMELRTSNRHTTFMERALTHTLTPGTETGVLAKNLVMNNRLFWGAGVFRDADSYVDGRGDGAYNVTGRIVGLPLYAEDGKRLLHLGVSGNHRNPDGVVRFRSRPEAHLSNYYYVDTGDILVDDEDLLGLELAWVNGPFSLQSEYIIDRVDTRLAGDADFSAYYVFVSYFLTGESRYYDLGSATFDRPRPRKNFRGPQGGPGAWEIAVRFSNIDLNDGEVRGGSEDDITLGLNWYFNPNAKLMLNYVRAKIDHDSYDGDLDILQIRAQVDF